MAASGSEERTCDDFFRYVKLAAAVAVIRGKPAGLSGQQYAERLCSQFTSSQLDWKMHSESLQQQVLALQQQLMQVELQQQRQRPADNSEGDVDLSGQAVFPTPPSTLDDHAGSEQGDAGEVTLSRHVTFLQSVLALQSVCPIGQHAGLACQHKDVIISTIDDALCKLQQAFCTDSVVISPRAVQHTATVVARLASSNRMIGVHQRLMAFLQALLDSMLDRREPGQFHHQRIVCDVILTTAAQAHILHHDVVRMLVKTIADYSAVLRLAIGDGTKLEWHRHDNVCYVFNCLEQLLVDMLRNKPADALDAAFLLDVDTILDDCLLHLSDRFALFAHYVWHVGGMVQALRERMHADSA